MVALVCAEWLTLLKITYEIKFRRCMRQTEIGIREMTEFSMRFGSVLSRSTGVGASLSSC